MGSVTRLEPRRIDSMVIRPQPLRALVGCLVCLCGVSLLPGCGGEPPPPPTGSAEFDAQKKDYQEVRRKERGLPTFDPAEAKKEPAKK
jgi:hypothetical protein